MSDRKLYHHPDLPGAEILVRPAQEGNRQAAGWVEGPAPEQDTAAAVPAEPAPAPATTTRASRSAAAQTQES